MASSDIHHAASRATFGPEACPPSGCTSEGLAGGGDTAAVAAAAAAAAAVLERGVRARGDSSFAWSVRVEAPKSSASSDGSQAAAAAAGQRPVESSSTKMPPLVRPEYAMPVDDAVVVKRLTSQVESSSITTRNGAIQREMQDAYRKLICANVERKLTLQDVASFSTFLVGVRVRLHQKGSNLRRRHSVLSSLLKHAPRARVQRIYSDLAVVEEQESALTKDVDLFNKLQKDLKESPAYKAMMEYGQSSGMVNVHGTMMPDPTKHPELEAMASMSVKDMLAEFKMEDKRNEQQSNNNRAVAAAAAAAASASAPSTAGTPSSSVSSSSSFSSSSSSSSSPYSFPSSSSADSARGGDVAVGPDAGRLGAAVVEPGSSQKPRKGKKGKKERRR